MKKLISLVMIVILVMAAFSGCNSQKDSGKNNAEVSKPADPGQSKANTELSSGNASKENEAGKAETDKVFKAVLYFPDKEAMGVIKEERDIKADGVENLDVTQKAKLVIEELVKGSSEGLKTSIPKATKVMSVKQDKDILIVDLSREFDKDHNGGSAGVLMTMSQLVLTLTEFEGIKQVSFKIEGRTIEEFKGSIEFNLPFKRSDYEEYISK